MDKLNIPGREDNQISQKNDFQLLEGEEVSLGIFKKLPSQTPTQPLHPHDNLQSLSTNNINESESANSQVKPVVVVTKKPMINLAPKVKPNTNSQYQLSSKQQKALAKLNKLRKHEHWYNIKLVVGTVMVFLLIFYSQFFISQFMYIFNKPSTSNEQNNANTTTLPTTNPTQPTQSQPTQSQAEVVGPQNEIIIPKIGVRAPLVFIDTNNEVEVLRALRDGVVHYNGTAYPGEIGNSVFFGHSSNDWWEPGNYKFVFVLLEKLVPGDTYEIHYNSRKYVYVVTETKVVPPTDLSVLNQTSEPISTLITCTPPGTSWRRFIVHAKQTSPAPHIVTQPSTQQAPQLNTNISKTTTLPSAPPDIWDQIINFFKDRFDSNRHKTNNQPNQNTTQHLPEVN
jgi:LPXTG-site transpeptidase (sortase) family protein